MNQIRRDELRAMLAGGALRDGRMVLIEALPAAHYAAEHIPGAVSVPEVTAEAAARVAPDKTTTVVTYCSGPSCGRSKAAANALRNLGYRDVRVYAGGKADWAEAGLPFEGARALPVQEAA